MRLGANSVFKLRERGGRGQGLGRHWVIEHALNFLGSFSVIVGVLVLALESSHAQNIFGNVSLVLHVCRYRHTETHRCMDMNLLRGRDNCQVGRVGRWSGGSLNIELGKTIL